MQENIIVRIGADISDFISQISQASGDLQGFGENASAVGSDMAKIFGTTALAIGTGLGYAVKQAADFDTEMRKAGAIAGASAKELDAMRDSALELGAKTSESASSVSAAMTEMAAKGFTANQTIAAMPGVIAAAEASGEDLALAADTVATALNIFGLEASQSSKVADVLAMTANQSAAGITDMQYALKYAGAPAAALGISLEELSGAIGTIVDSGLDGSSAGTALRASLLALNNPAKAQAKIMNGLGFSLTDAEGKTKSLSEMIRDMTAATAHMTEAEKVATLGKLVGTEAVSGFLALMKAGPETIDANTLALQNSEGAAAATAAQMKDGIGGALENLSGAFETLTIMIGDVLVPYVQMAAEWLANLAEKFTGLSEGTKQFLVIGTAIVGIFSAIAAAVGVAMVVFGMIVSSLGTLATALGVTGGATGLLSAAFAAITGPVGIAVAAIVGIIAAVVLAYNKIGWFRDMVNAAWAKIKELTVIAFNAIKKAITDAIAAVLAFVKPQLDKFKAFWDENGKAIKLMTKTSFESIAIIIKGVMNVIQGLFQTVWPLISSTVRYAWETIKLIVSTAINIVLGVVQTVLKVLQGDWKGAWETIKTTLVKIWDDVGKYLKGIDLAETGKDIIRGLIKGISSMGESIKKTVSDLADKIPEWAKKVLGIHSPSRVMAALGVFTGQGLANGIIATQKLVKDAITGLTNIIKNVTKANNSDIITMQKKQADEEKAIETKKARDIANIHAIAKSQKRALTLSETQRIEKIEDSAATKLIAVQNKYAKDSLKVTTTNAKDVLAAVKTFVDDKKSLNELSLVAETEVWRKTTELFKVGTKERVEAQKAYQASLKAVNDEVIRINTEYMTKQQTINDNLAKSEQALNDEYNKAFSSRIQAITSFAGLFDEFVAQTEKSGSTLIANLQSQVTGLTEWRAVLDSLWGKIDDQALMEELEALGPKALGELMALNSMTAEQLAQYASLYQQKATLAREQAEEELIGMKADTTQRITELRAAANVELATMQTEWVAKIQAVTKATDDEFKSLTQIGKTAGQNLLDGLKSMEGALVAQATAIAQAVNAALQTSLGGSVKVAPYSAPSTSASAGRTSSTSTTKASTSGTTYTGPVSVTIDAKNVTEFNNVVDFMNALPQQIRKK